jgi:hypothetical protein
VNDCVAAVAVRSAKTSPIRLDASPVPPAYIGTAGPHGSH